MRSCRETAQILDSGENLSFFTKLELRLHLMMCEHCKNYGKQLKVLKRALTNLFHTEPVLPENEKKRLEDKIIGGIS